MGNFVCSTELAYAAGVIDGEGTIGIATVKPRGRRKSPSFRGYVSMAQTDIRLCIWMQERFGGRIFSYPARKPGQKGIHHWRIGGPTILDFLSDVRPYLVLKGEQADLVARLYTETEFKQRRSLPSDIITARTELASGIHALNQRGAEVGGQ